MITAQILKELEQLAITKGNAEFPRMCSVHPTILMELVKLARAELETQVLVRQFG